MPGTWNTNAAPAGGPTRRRQPADANPPTRTRWRSTCSPPGSDRGRRLWVSIRSSSGQGRSRDRDDRRPVGVGVAFTEPSAVAAGYERRHASGPKPTGAVPLDAAVRRGRPGRADVRDFPRAGGRAPLTLKAVEFYRPKTGVNWDGITVRDRWQLVDGAASFGRSRLGNGIELLRWPSVRAERGPGLVSSRSWWPSASTRRHGLSGWPWGVQAGLSGPRTPG
jgi:hypothetical protein